MCIPQKFLVVRDKPSIPYILYAVFSTNVDGYSLHGRSRMVCTDCNAECIAVLEASRPHCGRWVCPRCHESLDAAPKPITMERVARFKMPYGRHRGRTFADIEIVGDRSYVGGSRDRIPKFSRLADAYLQRDVEYASGGSCGMFPVLSLLPGDASCVTSSRWPRDTRICPIRSTVPSGTHVNLQKHPVLGVVDGVLICGSVSGIILLEWFVLHGVFCR